MLAPKIIRIMPPIIVIHFLYKGALVRSQPVMPPNSSSVGDIAVPMPNSIAVFMLSMGAAVVAA